MIYTDTDRPLDFNPKFEAVGCYVEYADKILLLRHRKKPSKTVSKKWGLPGGKVEYGEFPDQAIWRELREETDIESHEIVYVCTFLVRGKCYDFEYHVYRLVLTARPDVRLSPRQYLRPAPNPL